MSEHTPGPWKRDSSSLVPNLYPFIAGPNGEAIADVWGDVDVANANAEFIVRACNAHDDLLVACEEALEDLAFFNAEWDCYDEVEGKCRTAIAKAKGES